MTASGGTQGHYVCDIKESSSGRWFRTNDNNDPLPIKCEEVSKYAYVILYKRINKDRSDKINAIILVGNLLLTYILVYFLT